MKLYKKIAVRLVIKFCNRANLKYHFVGRYAVPNFQLHKNEAKTFVTKNRCVTHVKIRGYANFVSSLLAYLISTVVS